MDKKDVADHNCNGEQCFEKSFCRVFAAFERAPQNPARKPHDNEEKENIHRNF